MEGREYSVLFLFDLSYYRGKSQRGKATYDGTIWVTEADDQPSRPAMAAGEHNDVAESNKIGESESEAVSSSQDQAKLHEQNVLKVGYRNSFLEPGTIM